MGGHITVRNPRWLSYFEIHHAQVPRYRLGRVLLAGDAAHVHSPAAAQGMNTGIQDAANLAWKLALVASHRADHALLDSYHDERHPVGAMVVRTTTRLTNMSTATGPKEALRDLALFLVGHLPSVAATAAATMAETTINYRHSALSVHHGAPHRGATRAGDHALDPDGLCRPDGTPVTIEELLTTPGMLLLVRSRSAEQVDELRRALGDLGTVVRVVHDGAGASADCLVDPDDVLARTYGMGTVGVGLTDPTDILSVTYGLGSEGLALIRPDGYLGLVADSASTTLVRNYLAGALCVTQPSTV